MKLKRKATRADAKMVTLMAWHRYEHGTFKTGPQSSNYLALLEAQKLGYVWFPTPTKAAVTTDGRKALAEYGVPQEPDLAEVAKGAT